MADQQPRLFAFPSRDDDTYQSEDIFEEFPVELNFSRFASSILGTSG